MDKTETAGERPIIARVVHRSTVVNQPGMPPVLKLMLNLVPGERRFEPGCDIAFAAEGDGSLRYYTVESVGQVPFEDSIDLTLYVRVGEQSQHGVASMLAALSQGDTVPVRGPFAYPFYPPMGSRSNLVFIGAGCGMVPFRWLAHKIHGRRLDWMGKVLMLEGSETGLEYQYRNDPDTDQDQYFDAETFRAFERLKTRYSAVASDSGESTAANMDAMWRLMGQGSVFVYVAGYRDVVERMHAAMDAHLRLQGRWQEAREALVRNGHWLEFVYG
ncbi:MAG: hypothetical protein KDI88_06285 [Gammaproteobacteria bacterium]|nr:hypothetical protein [Gammaproteobacteria bacterium]